MAENDRDVPDKVPQPHGGALYAGGVRGNNGGRPPSAVRRLCRDTFEEFLPKLRAIVENPASSAADVIRAIDLLGKYGLGTQLGLVDEEGNTSSGIIALPALEMSALQDRMDGQYGDAQAPPEPVLERVEETVDVTQRQDRDQAPPPMPSDTVDPSLVRAIRARRNGHGAMGPAVTHTEEE